MARRRAALSFVALFAALLVVGTPPLRADEVDLRLALMIDASGSVDSREYRLQRQGYVEAFRDARVIDAIRNGYFRKIAVTVVEWTGPALQAAIAEWTVLSDDASIEAFGRLIAEQPRFLYGGGTAVGAAILFGATLIDESGHTSRRSVIDVSGDGVTNRGIQARLARDQVAARGFTVNGLPILTDEPYLDKYYEANVIGGPGAFMIPAKSFEDFGKAIRAKLIREIAGREQEDETQTAER